VSATLRAGHTASAETQRRQRHPIDHWAVLAAIACLLAGVLLRRI
jgi:hypothetical protein